MMIPRELKIKELEKLLLKELYEEYRKKPGAMPDGNDYYEYIKEKYKSDYNISRNDFIISLDGKLETKTFDAFESDRVLIIFSIFLCIVFNPDAFS
ncbi:hypothetical protein LCGC14_2075400 [marine sediment metagenome]|uniref:Uncharacterized protein n=1 Tax=marine sediment metagenome TaxID=412755 RepID=A0A0F9F4J3_9ZZZZ